MNKTNKYSFINAKIRAKLSRLISRQELFTFFSAKDLPGIIELLNGTDYKIPAESFSKEKLSAGIL